MEPIHILGGGPAGSAAALAALAEGASVVLAERSAFPRHKVCGEFVTPEIEIVLEQLGLRQQFLAAGPALMRRMYLRIGRTEKRAVLPEAAYGLSRHKLDCLLYSEAVQRGAIAARESASQADIIAGGRDDSAPRGRRIFGFKAHFEGPPNDTVELYFFDNCYVGVNPVEGGRTNVCGIGPEDVLSTYGFDPEGLLESFEPLHDRVRALTRTMKWLSAGPLVFRQRWDHKGAGYPAGDALSFVDPFTGTGILSAMLTGRLAGISAARRTPLPQYLAECRKALRGAYRAASLFRAALWGGWGERLAPMIPGEWLYRLTRPRT